MKDLRGVEINIGDRIIYGKSDRNNPIKLGYVKSIDGSNVNVLGDGNKKVGVLYSRRENSERILVLPDHY